MSEENSMRENEVPQDVNVFHILNENEKTGDGMGEWTYSMWIDPPRQDKLEACLREMGIDYTCQRLVF